MVKTFWTLTICQILSTSHLLNYHSSGQPWLSLTNEETDVNSSVLPTLSLLLHVSTHGGSSVIHMLTTRSSYKVISSWIRLNFRYQTVKLYLWILSNATSRCLFLRLHHHPSIHVHQLSDFSISFKLKLNSYAQ